MFEECCKILCTQDEICSLFRVDDMTLNAWCHRTYQAGFSEMYKHFSMNPKQSLRRAMYQSAMMGNPTMLIFMAKHHLGMHDHLIGELPKGESGFKLSYSIPDKKDDFIDIKDSNETKPN